MLKLNIVSNKIDESWTIEKICDTYPPATWDKVFLLAKDELKTISAIVENQEIMHGRIYPLKKDIFNAFNLTPLNTVKVVIIGQDPYHQIINSNGNLIPRATGLSFSVRKEDVIPSSLKNIFTELTNTVRGFNIPEHGDLTEWTQQGILLLNSSLTVNPSDPGSHGEIWLCFIKHILKEIARVNPQCIYVLWGREAQKIKPLIGNKSIILEAAHPSGLSARRGFFGCDHFNLINEHLINLEKQTITWSLKNTI
jgi:uracil-DNA glycosylase